MKSIVLIPAYQPSTELAPLVAELVSLGVERIIVVNDGSSPECQSVFGAVRAHPQVQLLRHAVNLGKGSALKTGINAILCEYPEIETVVTADADGQHAPADIIRVIKEAEKNPGKLILGARKFSGDVPLRSRLGNELTRLVVQMVSGQKLLDTQTGLRAIPVRLLPELLRLKTHGYEFEMDMLIACKDRGIGIAELPIETIYIEGNRSSHFNPLLDSMRIYFVLLRFASVGLLTALLDNVVFMATFWTSGNIAVSQVVARVASTGFNYQAIKKAVFISQEKHGVTLLRYLALVVVSGTISYGLIQVMQAYLPIRVLTAKLIAETVLFFVNFLVERDFVFVTPVGEPAEER